jgi:hypothetical protein
VEPVVNDRYEVAAPDAGWLVAGFEGQWVSALPGQASGEVPLFEDDRIRWAVSQASAAKGKKVLGLSPLEGGHTYLNTSGLGPVVAASSLRPMRRRGGEHQ